MDPLNARAAWSSVVGVLERAERSQKNKVENIFEFFPAPVLDKLLKILTGLRDKDASELNLSAISHLLQVLSGLYETLYIRRSSYVQETNAYLDSAILKPSVRATQ